MDEPAGDVVAADLRQREHQVLGANEAGGETVVTRLDVPPIIRMLFALSANDLFLYFRGASGREGLRSESPAVGAGTADTRIAVSGALPE